MNQAVFAFRRYEDASLRYTGIESHEGLTRYGPMTPLWRGVKNMHMQVGRALSTVLRSGALCGRIGLASLLPIVGSGLSGLVRRSRRYFYGEVGAR